MPAKSYLSASEFEVTFGLGPNTKIDAAEVIWPSGAKQIIADMGIDRRNVVQESR
jgi:hypothetical protein